MKKHLSAVTLHYMLITAGFWMSFCLVSTNAAVFLQAIGYSNVQLGIIMALGNIGGALLSTLLGDFLDRHPRVRHIQVLRWLSLAQILTLALLRLFPRSGPFASVTYTVYCSALMAVNAVNLDLCVRLEHVGADLNFGLARSMGSIAFMVVSVLMGVLVERFSHLVLLYAGLAIILFQLFSNRLVDRDLKEAEAHAPAWAAAARQPSASLPAFIRQNPAFAVLLLGIILIFTAHNMDGNFMINEIRALGGGTADMGIIAAFQALMEVPVMVLASRLPKKWSHAQYIRLSFLFFVIKILAYALAPSLPFFFAARVLQAPSYALYIVLIVSYADQVVPHQDSAKAQGLLVSVTNIGAVLASLAGGAMFDTLGVRPTMLIATGIALAGAVIGCLGARDERRQPTLS
ncbi:MAG: MFS transporter [Clostridia bacterium]|nr:MFS transporter [Clostridia bacterium]